MDARIGQVQVAGAGAGKTYEMSNRIINRYRNLNDHKKVYCITFTNSSKRSITEKIKEHLGIVPDNIVISTIHSFLLNEVIYPFSSLILDLKVNKAISSPLPAKPQYKNYQMKRLNEYGYIHNDQVFQKAKCIISKKGKKKTVQIKIDLVLQHIKDSIDSIFIDEAQDMDANGFELIDILSSSGIYVYLVGDPKQALMYPKAFSSFISSIENRKKENFELTDFLTHSWRVPEEHLQISNKFCPMGQEQTSRSTNAGELKYIFVDSEGFDDEFHKWKLEGAYIYIDKKNAIFDTHINKKEYFMPESVKDILRNKSEINKKYFDIWIESLIDEFVLELEKKSLPTVVREFLKKYTIEYDKKIYAELCSSFSKLETNNNNYTVMSIHKVKGLEAEKCIFVVDNNMASYLFGKKNEFNREMNKLYVALTRSRRKLIFAVDIKSISSVTKEEALKWFSENDVTSY